MMSRDVIPTVYMQNLTVEQLLPHNEKYFQECLDYIEKLILSQEKVSKNEIINLVLLQIRETQLDGKRAEQRLGSEPSDFVQKLIEERYKLLLFNIFIHKFQFPAYAFSLYLVGYAFFVFLFAAWFEYKISEAFFIPIPFSSIGLLMGFCSVTAAFLYLFYNRQKSKLLYVSPYQHVLSKEPLIYLWIGTSFAFPSLFLHLQVALFQVDLWMLFVFGIVGIGFARQRFIATDTLPE